MRQVPAARAVVAHRHPWFAARITEALTFRGVAVLAVTDNGADALGVSVAEQPDVLVVGEMLEMLPVQELLAHASSFVPSTLRAAQAADAQRVGVLLDAGAQTVFAEQVPPDAVAEHLLVALSSTGAGRAALPRPPAPASVTSDIDGLG